MKDKRGFLMQDYMGYILLGILALVIIVGAIFVLNGKLSGMIGYFKQLIGFS